MKADWISPIPASKLANLASQTSTLSDILGGTDNLLSVPDENSALNLAGWTNDRVLENNSS